MGHYYFYSDGRNQFGPVSKEELKRKGIAKGILVWHEGLTEWIKAGDLAELEDLFPKEKLLENELWPPSLGRREGLPAYVKAAKVEDSHDIFPKKEAVPVRTSRKGVIITACIALLLVSAVIVMAVLLQNPKNVGLNDNTIASTYSLKEKVTSKKLKLHSSVSHAQKIRSNSATLKGTLNSKSDEVISYSFEYSQNGYSNTLPAILNGNELYAQVTGLRANTLCKFCIVEKQNDGTIKTGSSSFTTLPPSIEIHTKVTTHTGRLFAALSFYNPIKKKIIAACDYRDNVVRSKAAEIASQTEGNFNIGQVCDIFDYCYDNWKYVNDPYKGGLYQKASNTIQNGLTGDCDDFAILMASLMLAVGGDARVNVAYMSDSGHAYTELNVGKTDMTVFANYIRARYGFSGNIWYRTDSNGNNWLNLDWQARHPGGEYYGGKRGARIYVIDKFVEEFSYR